MPESRTFVLIHDQARRNASEYALVAPENQVVVFKDNTRSSAQNRHFHKICHLLEKSNVQWCGKKRNSDEWKVLLVSAHSVATKEGAEIVPGIEGEFVNIRESTARMNKKRSSSLIEYAIAFAASNGIDFKYENEF